MLTESSPDLKGVAEGGAGSPGENQSQVQACKVGDVLLSGAYGRWESSTGDGVGGHRVRSLGRRLESVVWHC